MSDSISIIETEQIQKKIEIILRQTDYTEEIAREKLKENNFDEIATIKDFFGINKKKTTEIKSVNQEIYKQLRTRLDSNLRSYEERKIELENNKK
jgi:hypothetical protein